MPARKPLLPDPNSPAFKALRYAAPSPDVKPFLPYGRPQPQPMGERPSAAASRAPQAIVLPPTLDLTWREDEYASVKSIKPRTDKKIVALRNNHRIASIYPQTRDSPSVKANGKYFWHVEAVHILGLPRNSGMATSVEEGKRAVEAYWYTFLRVLGLVQDPKA